MGIRGRGDGRERDCNVNTRQDEIVLFGTCVVGGERGRILEGGEGAWKPVLMLGRWGSLVLGRDSVGNAWMGMLDLVGTLAGRGGGGHSYDELAFVVALLTGLDVSA